MEPPHYPDLRTWFSDDELEQCPRCRQHPAVTTSGVGAVVCNECGVVGFRADSSIPDVELHELPKRQFGQQQQ
jgi:hypothetical protein